MRTTILENVSSTKKMVALSAFLAVGTTVLQFDGQQGSLAHWGPTLSKPFNYVIGESKSPIAECANSSQKNCMHP